MGVRHPARFTDVILAEAARMLPTSAERVLDPFAGTGKGVDFMWAHGWKAVGVELEPEWAALSRGIVVGSALALPFAPNTFEAVFTSPCYGNRMADHHEARDDSRRNTYRHALGRPLTVGSTAGIQWGDAYRTMHVRAWSEAIRVLKPGGCFLLNCKDHIRAGERQFVTQWHVEELERQGLILVEGRRVKCPGNRQGANGQARIDYESLVLLRKP